MDFNKRLHLGTCSWKYPSWKGLVYSSGKPQNPLLEYARHYSTVEIDQWFWSLFGDSVVLPKAEVVKEYFDSVPDTFRFGIKVPNAITLTHHYRKSGQDTLVPNEHFLSVELMQRFLDTIEPLFPKLGPLMFQFEYLNKQKMVSQNGFLERLAEFIDMLPAGPVYAVETRNPNYLNNRYFDFLRSHRLAHVFLQGYYMPSIFDIYRKFKGQLGDMVVIRLHGPDRKAIEELTKKNWNQIVAPKDADIDQLSTTLTELESEVYLYVNNHFEGSAPRTIARIMEHLGR